MVGYLGCWFTRTAYLVGDLSQLLVLGSNSTERKMRKGTAHVSQEVTFPVVYCAHPNTCMVKRPTLGWDFPFIFAYMCGKVKVT